MHNCPNSQRIESAHRRVAIQVASLKRAVTFIGARFIGGAFMSQALQTQTQASTTTSLERPSHSSGSRTYVLYLRPCAFQSRDTRMSGLSTFSAPSIPAPSMLIQLGD